MVEYGLVNLATFVVGVGLLINGYVLVRRGREDVALLVVSAVVGLGLIVVALAPDVFQVVARILGLELKARAILVVSNLTLFVVAIYLFNRVGRLYERVSRLNEELSLLKNEVEETVEARGGPDGRGETTAGQPNPWTAIGDGGDPADDEPTDGRPVDDDRADD